MDLFRVVMSEVLVNREFAALYHKQVVEPALITIEPVLKTWIVQRKLKGFDERLIARILAGLTLGMIVQRIMNDAVLETLWDTLPQQLTDVMLGGIAQSKS